MAMRSTTTTKFASGRILIFSTLLLLSLMTVTSLEAANSGLKKAELSAASVESAPGEQMNPTTEVCLLAEQLKDPSIRADYDTIIADTERTGFNRSVLLDPISMECNA